jgi:hypothetical protein
MPELSDEMLDRIHRILELAEIDKAYAPKSKEAISPILFKEMNKYFSFLRLKLELRECSQLSAIISYYRTLLLIIINWPDSRYILSQGTGLSMSENQDVKSALIELKLISDEKADPLVWPGFSLNCMLIVACAAFVAHAHVGLPIIFDFFTFLYGTSKPDREVMLQSQWWLFDLVRLHGDVTAANFKTLLNTLSGGISEFMNSKQGEDIASETAWRAIGLIDVYHSMRMHEKSVELLKTLTTYLQSNKWGEAIEPLLAEDLKCCVVSLEWQFFYDGYWPKPEYSLEAMLDNELFKLSSNYSIAISLFNDRNGPWPTLLEYLRSYSSCPESPFVSSRWASLTMSIEARLKNGESANSEWAESIVDIISLLASKGNTVWLQYVPLAPYHNAVYNLYFILQSNLYSCVGETVRHSVCASLLNVRSKVQRRVIQIAFVDNLTGCTTANRWRRMCTDIYRVFYQEISESQEVRNTITELTQVASKDSQTALPVCIKAMKLVKNKYATEPGRWYQSVGLLVILEQVAKAAADENSSMNHLMSDIEDCWYSFGFEFTKSLIESLVENEDVQPSVKAEIARYGQLFNFNKVVDKVRIIVPQQMPEMELRHK